MTSQRKATRKLTDMEKTTYRVVLGLLAAREVPICADDEELFVRFAHAGVKAHEARRAILKLEAFGLIVALGDGYLRRPL